MLPSSTEKIIRMIDDFAVFILTHGRPDRVHTYNRLIDDGYTGPIFIVIDNEDKLAREYGDRYGDKVIMFDKEEIAKTFDEGDNFGDRRAVIYARNACFGFAETLGYTYFLELDDDYGSFSYTMDSYFRAINGKEIKSLDEMFEKVLEYYKSIPAKSISWAQGGDFLGGLENDIDEKLLQRRKCMNTFFCSTERPFQFIGRINEDVNTYTCYQSKGNLFMMFPLLRITQTGTQGNVGGMTELYLDSGTYVKSFYTVMYHPSGVRVTVLNSTHPRLHHQVSWNNTVPYIISEEYKK